MISRHTLLIYNFGLAFTFLVLGALTTVTFEHFLNRPAAVPPFDDASVKAIQEEQDLEKLRARALFYFGLGKDLKRARYSDTDALVRDFRFLCFLLGAIFLAGGTISYAATKKLQEKRA